MNTTDQSAPTRDPEGTQNDAAVAPEVDPAAPATEEPDEGEAKPSREAARYRRQLREAEAERDELARRLEANHRALAEELARSQGRVSPAALWANGATVESLLDEAGNVDPALVNAAVEASVEALGISRKPRPDWSQGPHHDLPGGDSWIDAFGPR